MDVWIWVLVIFIVIILLIGLIWLIVWWAIPAAVVVVVPPACPYVANPIPISPDSPEPWAALTDVGAASVAIEKAINAPTTEATKESLSEAATWLCYAMFYFTRLSSFQQLAGKTQYVLNELNQINIGVPIDGLNNYQSTVIYGFQGTISALYREVWVVWLKGINLTPYF